MTGARGGARGIVLRVLVLATLAGGLWFASARRPRSLGLEVDLFDLRGMDIAELDVTVRRDDHAIARIVRSFPARAAGAQPTPVPLRVDATPGPAEFEVTVTDRGGRAVRHREQAVLSEDHPPSLRVRREPGG